MIDLTYVQFNNTDVHSRSSDIKNRMSEHVEYVRVKDSGFSMSVSYGPYDMGYTISPKYTLICIYYRMVSQILSSLSRLLFVRC